MQEPLGKPVRQFGFANSLLRFGHVVHDTEEFDLACVRIIDGEARTPVSVARLSDRSGIDQKLSRTVQIERPMFVLVLFLIFWMESNFLAVGQQKPTLHV